MKKSIFLLFILPLIVTGCAITSVQIARSHNTAGNPRAAIEIIKTARLSKNEIPPALIEMGKAFFQLGDYAAAEKYLAKAYKMNPASDDAMFYLGRVYEKQNRLDQAVTVYSQYERLPASKRTRGLIAFQLNRVIREKIQKEVHEAVKNQAGFTAAPAASDRIAVLPFQNLGGSNQLRPLMKGLSEMLITDLSKVKSLTVLERIRVQALMDEMNLGKTGLVNPSQIMEAGRLLKAGTFIAGGVLAQKDQTLRIQASLSDLNRKSAQDIAHQSGNIRQLFDLEKKLVFKIFDTMKIRLSIDERNAIQTVPTENLMAFLAWSQGLDFEDQGLIQEAHAAYSRAISIDPGFEMPNMKIWNDMSIPASGNVEIETAYEKSSSDKSELADSDLSSKESSASGAADDLLTVSTLESLGNQIDAGFIPSYSTNGSVSISEVPYSVPGVNTHGSTMTTVRIEAVTP